MRISDWSSDVCSSDLILLLTFIISVTGLFVFIWSLRKHLFDDNPAAARVIFSEGEIGQVEEPALTEDRRQAMQAAIGVQPAADPARAARIQAELQERRSEEHTSELQSLMRISYAVFCLKK